MIDVLFLCTGNAARSVMAGVGLSTRRPDLLVATAGTFVVEGQPMSVRTRTAITDVGLPLPRHASRQATPDELDRAHCIVGLAPEHVEWVRRTHPAAAPRTVTLRRLVRDIPDVADLAAQTAALQPHAWDLEPWEEVVDPGGGELDVFQACAREVDELIAALALRLGGSVRRPEGEEVLRGGVANAGAVVRSGDHVLRPSNAHSASILRFLAGLEAAGFDGAPSPVGLEADGRERLRYIPGDVALPPFPDWAQSDDALASVADLIRRLHDASARVDTTGSTWSTEMADPAGGPVIAHNDVCLENVVFRDGRAVALLDFDFAAPGRRSFDVAAFARMCVPVDDEVSATALGWRPADRPRRLRLVCDAYGLDLAGRDEVLASLDASIERGGRFVQRRAEAGDPGFVRLWEQVGGMERYDRRRRWWADNRASFDAAMR